MKNVCPCCGLYVLEAEPGDFDICPVCKWEDDIVQRNDPDYTGGANAMSLNQAKALFAEGKDKHGNPIMLPLFSGKETDTTYEHVTVMANCRLVMAEGRAGVLV